MGAEPTLKEVFQVLGLRWKKAKRSKAGEGEGLPFPKGPEPEELVRAFFALYERTPAPIAPNALPLMALLVHQDSPSLGRRKPLGKASLHLALTAFRAMTAHPVPYLLVANMEDEAVLLMADYFARLHRTAELTLRSYRSLLSERAGRGGEGAA